MCIITVQGNNIQSDSVSDHYQLRCYKSNTSLFSAKKRCTQADRCIGELFDRHPVLKVVKQTLHDVSAKSARNVSLFIVGVQAVRQADFSSEPRSKYFLVGFHNLTELAELR